MHYSCTILLESCSDPGSGAAVLNQLLEAPHVPRSFSGSWGPDAVPQTRRIRQQLVANRPCTATISLPASHSPGSS